MNNLKLIDLIAISLKNNIQQRKGKDPENAMGAVSLLSMDPDWESKLPDLVPRMISNLEARFIRSKDPERATPLTATAISFGRTALSKHPDATVKDHIVVGDMFIEALYKTDVIELFKQPHLKGMHMVKAGHEWEELSEELQPQTKPLTGIVFEEPELTTKNIREWVDNSSSQNLVVKRVIKRSQHREISIDVEQPWVKAFDKQQQTPLMVNSDVLTAIEDNKTLFFNRSKFESKEDKMSYNSKKRAHEISIEKATEVLEEHELFYSMLDCDYRGRFYHTEGIFNYQGQDTARSLIQFYNGVELTERGEWWLAIHTACLFNQSYSVNEIPAWVGKNDNVIKDIGHELDYYAYLTDEKLDTISVDKMAMADRVEWTHQNMDKIVELGNTLSFWVHEGKLSADKPCQFLAACVEWAKLKEANAKGVPFLTHIPIAIDGSNNGWQHLAAMSRDKQAGELVGISAEDIPKDFYLATAKDLIKNMDDDRLAGILKTMNMQEIRKGISKRGSIN